MAEVTVSNVLKPVLGQYLNSLSDLLDAAAADAAARDYDVGALTDSRLAPDMFALAGQVHTACDLAVRGAARLAGLEAPSNDHDITSIDGLKKRIADTRRYVEELSDEMLDAGLDRDITFRLGDQGSKTLTGTDYLFRFMLPNFFFHVTATYNLLRHNGVQIGKRDYMGALTG